jgi:hypothetical protein
MQKLTARQEQFAQGLMKGLPQRTAYQLAGYNVKDAKVADAAAGQALRSINLQARLAEMERDKALAETVTAHTVTRMLATVFEAASRDRQHGAAATAAMGIAKLHGLLIDKLEDVTRRPARSPDAPLEIEVEHWLSDHKLIGQSPNVESPTLESPNTSDDLGMFD